MDTIDILERVECCGCSSCAQKCPRNAIHMEEDAEGFEYPIVDKEKCVGCGLCVQACPQIKSINKDITELNLDIYAMHNKSEEELMSSSSGGVFSAIAGYVLENDGAVCGAAYDENLNVKHVMAYDKKQLCNLRKSKYVQSNINNSYIMVEKNLEEGRLVLFVGTPCQVFGLRKFLMKEYDNLITCDIVCHGVPSPKAFEQYLKYMSNKMKTDIKSYDFRSKDIDGCEKIGKIIGKNGKIKYLKIGLDCYYSNFLEGNLFRECCYRCKYSNINRVGDITLGDYLGVLQVQPQAYNSRGTSICIVNSDKGRKIFEKIRDEFVIYETSYEKVSKYNSNLNNPKDRPECRSFIYRDINDYSKFIKDMKMYMKIKNKIKSLIPIRIKNCIKKIGGGK